MMKNFLEIDDHEKLAVAVKSSSKVLVDRIIFSWQEDLELRRKWNFTEEESKKLFMKETCFMINDEQIELLHPIMEEEPKCKVTFGQGSLETLSLVLRFKLTDMKVTGTLRSYSPSKPCKSFPYELFLKDVEFEIVAGLVIRTTNLGIDDYSNDYLNFNVNLFYKNKDESKQTCPLDKIQDLSLRKSIEKYIVDKLTKDIIYAVQDRVADECTNTSVVNMLDNECSYRNKLRIHKKRITILFERFLDNIINTVKWQLESQKLSDVNLPDLYGKLLEKNNERGYFKATEGYLTNLASLTRHIDITVYPEGEDIIIIVFLFFSYLNIAYKYLSINRKDFEKTRSFETPENSNSSYMKIKVHKLDDEKVSLTLLDYKVDDLGYIEVNWDSPENDSSKKFIEPELAMWLNYTLEYKIKPIIEERIKNCLNDALKDKHIILSYNLKQLDVSDSDPLSEDEEDNEIKKDQE